MNLTPQKKDEPREASRKLSEAHDLLVKSTKIASLVGSICGFLYLHMFTLDAGIPFPLELNVLPTMLVSIGTASVVCTLVVIGGMLIPALMADDPLGIANGYFHAANEKEKRHTTRLRRYFLCTWIPMALALMALIIGMKIVAKGIGAQTVGAILLVTSLLWIFATPRYVEALTEKRWQYVIGTCLHILLGVWAYSLTVILAIALVPEMEEWPAWIACLVVLAVFSFFHLFVSVPTDKRPNAVLVLPPHFKRETTPAVMIALGLACALTISTVLMPQVAAKVGRTVLRAFRVGGGIPAIVCLKTPPEAVIAKRLGIADKELCSQVVDIQFDSGDKVYVTERPVGPKAAMTSGEDKPEPIYLRQDDIKQKIYVRQKKGQKTQK